MLNRYALAMLLSWVVFLPACSGDGAEEQATEKEGCGCGESTTIVFPDGTTITTTNIKNDDKDVDDEFEDADDLEDAPFEKPSSGGG